MPDNINKLYKELESKYELGSEADFRKYLSDGKNREALRKELEAEYDVGDSASFSKYLGFDVQPQQAPAQTVAQQPKTQDASVSHPQQPATPFQMQQGFGQLDMTANQFGKQSWNTPKEGQVT